MILKKRKGTPGERKQLEMQAKSTH
uniref:Uncharacterized protein n=1 Tax=Rhizophora mucronata TaxID=61149 RepID=A0A2P2Q8E3_RHIMU